MPAIWRAWKSSKHCSGVNDMAEQHGKTLVPEIRFSGFTDPWEQRKLGELYQKNDERNTDGLGSERTLSVASMTFNSTGNGADESSLPSYKRLRLGDIAFEGHANKEFAYGRFVLNDAGNGIMSPRFTCLRPIVEQEYSFWKYFIHSEEVMRPILVNSTKSGTMMNELVVKDFLEQEILVPSLPEQRQIGAFFDCLDSLITLHQRKYDKLCVLKKSMLDKMFPKGGSLYPEIRFSGFTDPWEQRKLGELYQKNDERNTDGLGSERTLSVASMTFNSTGNGADESSLPSYKRLRLGDIAFEGHANKEFAYGRFVLNDAGNGIMSPRFTCLRPIVEQEYSFWKYFIHSEEVMRPILVNSTKSGTMMNELVVKDFLEQEILVPSLPEQRQIGAFFDCLDSLITLHQRKLELLRNIKKSMLDKMFV